jgi:hypothetical protein
MWREEQGITYTEPVDDVGVGGRAGAAGVLLITSRLDHDWVLEGSLARGVQGAHVKDVDVLHLSENLQTLQTGGLLEVGRDGSGGGTGTEQVGLGADLCALSASGSLGGQLGVN